MACPVCGGADRPTGDPAPIAGLVTTAGGPGFAVHLLASAGPGVAPGGRETLPDGRFANPLVPGAPVVTGYTIVEEIGRGGMGVVYRAVNEGLARVEVIKTVRAGMHAGDEELRRFRAEAEAVARLRHENIVQVHQVGTANHGGQQVPYMALEFLEGGSLDKRIAGTPWTGREAAKLVGAVARAVQAAHEQNIVHRDLKPSNILLTGDGTPKVTDFGIAKFLDGDSNDTRTGSVLGTPSYMAPEQALARRDVGTSADVYALGAVLYELLTGRPPFKAATVLETLEQVRKTEPVPPSQLNASVPGDAETVCMKCLAKQPENRYASAGELADDLRRFLDNQPILAKPPGWGVRFRLWCRRPGRIYDAGAFMVFFGLICILWTLSGILFVALGLMTPTNQINAIIQLSLFIVMFYIPTILIGLRTMARRRTWLWVGVGAAVIDLALSLSCLLGSNLISSLSDVGGLHRDPNVRYPVFSLLFLLTLVQFFGYCVALVSYSANPDLVE